PAQVSKGIDRAGSGLPKAKGLIKGQDTLSEPAQIHRISRHGGLAGCTPRRLIGLVEDRIANLGEERPAIAPIVIRNFLVLVVYTKHNKGESKGCLTLPRLMTLRRG